MEGVERAVQSACEALDILAGPLVTIVIIALMFDLCSGNPSASDSASLR
jgi:hypothetical protein